METPWLKRDLPILSWLPHYDRSWLTIDVIAGLTLWGLVVPETMAYASIAGLPPQAGLYTLLAALLVYALFGTSRHLVVQTTSATAALLASSVASALVATAAVNASDPETYQAYASAFVLVTGLVFLAAGLARLDGQLYYANAPTYRERVKAMIEEMESPPHAVVFDSSAWYEIDLTSVDIIRKLVKELQGKGINVYLADVHVPVLEHAQKMGFFEVISEDHVFPTVDLAVRLIEASL